MSAQQQMQPRPDAMHHQQPWWSGPFHGLGSALQCMQHNLQQLTNSLPKPDTSNTQHARQTIMLGSSSSTSTSAQLQFPVSQGHLDRQQRAVGQAANHTDVHLYEAKARPLRGTPQRELQQHRRHTQPVTKEELGRSTWVFLHTLAAQFPEHPSRQQQRDARQMIDSLTRIYPCADCAQHFQEIVRRDPPDVSSGPMLAQWMCRVHNMVNRRLGKPSFNCDLVGARWAPLDCDQHNSCDMTVGRPK